VAEPDYEVAIIGAVPGGIAAGKLLRDKGIHTQPASRPQAEELSA
jgi:cation diffusion facilitator CzcD-associated flavoprotein CzcO